MSEAQQKSQAAALNEAARNLVGNKADTLGDALRPPAVVEQGDGSRGIDGPRDGKKALYIRLPGDGWPEGKFHKELGAILCTNGIYRRDRSIMTIDHERGLMREMTPARFVTYPEKYCVPAKRKKKSEEGEADDGGEQFRWMAKSMSKAQAANCLESDWFVEQQRPLARVNLVRMPVRRMSGDDAGKIVLLAPGYDVESRTFTQDAGVAIDETMTLEAANLFLRDLLHEFPWGDWDGTTGRSRAMAVHIAAMLTAWAPGLLALNANRPGFLWMANAPASGKSLLAQVALVPVFGTARAQPMKTEEEFDKVLDTAAREAWPYMFLDNLTGLLKNSSLDAWFTTPEWTGREMSHQRSFSAPRMTQIFITGNSLDVSTDLARRLLICDLFLETMDPRSRTIERRIDDAWLARPDNRGRILSALWALIRHWDAQGRPRAKKPLNSFEEWSEIYGGIVEAAGFGSPLDAPTSITYGGDSTTRDLMTMLEVLADDVKRPMPKAVELEQSQENEEAAKRKTKDYTFEDLVECCREHELFAGWIEGRARYDGSEEVGFEIAPKTRSRLGKFFAAQFGGRVTSLPDGRKVKFGHRGKQRHRKFTVELL